MDAPDKEVTEGKEEMEEKEKMKKEGEEQTSGKESVSSTTRPGYQSPDSDHYVPVIGVVIPPTPQASSDSEASISPTPPKGEPSSSRKVLRRRPIAPLVPPESEPGTPPLATESESGSSPTSESEPSTPQTTPETEPGTPLTTAKTKVDTPLATLNSKLSTLLETYQNEPGNPPTALENEPGTSAIVSGNEPGNEPGTSPIVSGNEPGTSPIVSGNEPGTSPIVSRNEPGTSATAQQNKPSILPKTSESEPSSPVKAPEDKPPSTLPITQRTEQGIPPKTPESEQATVLGPPEAKIQFSLPLFCKEPLHLVLSSMKEMPFPPPSWSSSRGPEMEPEKLPPPSITAQPLIILDKAQKGPSEPSPVKQKLPSKLQPEKETVIKVESADPGFNSQAKQGGSAPASAMEKSITSFLGSPVGQVFANTIDRALEKSEEWLNYCFPSPEAGHSSETAREHEASGKQSILKEGCFVKINALSTQLRNRTFGLLLRHIKRVSQRMRKDLSLLDRLLDMIEYSHHVGTSSISSIPEKLSNMWAEWTTKNKPPSIKSSSRPIPRSISLIPEQLEMKALSLTRALAQELYETYHNLLPHVPELPAHLQEKVHQVYGNLEELQSHLAAAPSIKDLPSQFVLQSRQKIASAREDLDELLEFMAQNSATNWLSQSGSFKGRKQEPLFTPGIKETDGRNEDSESEDEAAPSPKVVQPPPSPPRL